MSEAIAKKEQQLPTQYGFTQEQVQIIKNMVCPKGTTDDELKIFLAMSQRMGLDPFMRQIYLMERRQKDKETGQWITTRKPEVAIDGYRATAESTGDYAGSDEPVFDYYNDNAKKVPRKATVTVWKWSHGQARAFSAAALWDEYYPGKDKGFMWDKMPHVMLAKVAEALALRKAFPKQLSGVYTTEEMAASDDRHNATSRALPQFDPDDLQAQVIDVKPVDEAPQPPESTSLVSADVQEPASPRAEPRLDSREDLRKNIIEKIFSLFGTNGKNIEDFMMMCTEWRQGHKVKVVGVKTLDHVSFDIRPGRKMSQAQVTWNKMKDLTPEEASRDLDVWRRDRALALEDDVKI